MKSLQLLCLCLVVALPAIARADGDDTSAPDAPTAASTNIVSVSVMRKVDDVYDRRALAFELSRRLGTSHAYAHAELAASETGSRSSTSFMDSATYSQYRVGLEGRSGWQVGRGVLWLVGGADVGYGRERWSLTAPSLNFYGYRYGNDGAMFVPRVALEAGERFRVRATFEVPLETGHDIEVAGSLGAVCAF